MRKFDDIVPPSRRKGADAKDLPATPKKKKADGTRFPYRTLVAALIVIVLSVAALFFFSTARIQITPNTVSVAVQASFTAERGNGTLPFDTITAQKIASQSVTSSGTKTVNTTASGKITVYNAQSKSQRLINNTRFATTGGLIFRIHSPITVPGGSASDPGTLTVTVYADKAGDTYNIGPTSFTVPGLAGTAQEDLVYARSASSMTGGASGEVPVIDASVESSARAALKEALAPDLAASLESQVPSGYILLPGSTQTSYQELSSNTTSEGKVEVREQGTITAVVFPNAALAGAIAESVAGMGYQEEPLTISSPDTLSLSMSGGFPASEDDEFAFTLGGTAPLVYTVDPSRIAAAVSGKTRSAAEVSLTNYPEIKRAVIILRPFWRKSFPEDPASISVEIAE